jgi:UDP-N-acetylmuramate dehydrogenase
MMHPDNLPCPGQFDVPMHSRTTFQVGGKARVLLEPNTEDEVIKALAWVKSQGLPLFVMGRGSNLVVSDQGYPGVILALGKNFSGVEWCENHAVAKAGNLLTDLVLQGTRRGLGGNEKLAGIPGTVGGAVAINAGAYGQEFGDCTVRVRSCTFAGELRVRNREECQFAYRHTRFTDDPEIILSAQIALTPTDPEQLRKVVSETQQARKDKQPLHLPNAGSLFKRPPNGYASQMVEQAGLKGFQVGGAAISEKHAGFAVNLGKATARDVWNLSQEVIARVESTHGVTLQREVIFLGDFSS